MKSVTVRSRDRRRVRRFHRRTRTRAEVKGPWSPLDAAYFLLLRTYARREKHARVPYDHREGSYGLGAWVSRKRRAYRHGELTPEQVGHFEGLAGWTWSPAEDRFEQSLQALRAYRRREGHCRVPGTQVEGGIRLGLWVANRRADYRKGWLSRTQVRRLEGVPGWRWDVRIDSFENGYRYLLRYVKREGHASVPVDYVEAGFRLGAWVHKRRLERRRMRPERERRLEALPGWTWNKFDSQFQSALRLLLAFRDREGHALVPARHLEAGFALGRWVSHVRQRRRALSRERRRTCESVPGWKWRARGR